MILMIAIGITMIVVIRIYQAYYPVSRFRRENENENDKNTDRNNVVQLVQPEYGRDDVRRKLQRERVG